MSYSTALLEAVRLKLFEDRVTISIGLSKVEKMDTYEILFARVDQVIYQEIAKERTA